jgi:hypothetical protein
MKKRAEERRQKHIEDNRQNTEAFKRLAPSLADALFATTVGEGRLDYESRRTDAYADLPDEDARSARSSVKRNRTSASSGKSALRTPLGARRTRPAEPTSAKVDVRVITSQGLMYDADNPDELSSDVQALIHRRKMQQTTTLSIDESPFIRFWKQVAGDAGISDMGIIFEDVDCLKYMGFRAEMVGEKNEDTRKLRSILTGATLLPPQRREAVYVGLLRPVAFSAWQRANEAVMRNMNRSLFLVLESHPKATVLDAISKLCASTMMRSTFSNANTQMKGAVTIATILGYESIFNAVMRAFKNGRI